jgi:hypothetical protein
VRWSGVGERVGAQRRRGRAASSEGSCAEYGIVSLAPLARFRCRNPIPAAPFVPEARL